MGVGVLKRLVELLGGDLLFLRKPLVGFDNFLGVALDFEPLLANVLHPLPQLRPCGDSGFKCADHHARRADDLAQGPAEIAEGASELADGTVYLAERAGGLVRRLAHLAVGVHD